MENIEGWILSLQAIYERKNFPTSKIDTCLADSLLMEEMYCVFTSQETPLSVGLSFLRMPSFLIGVTASSSRNSSSSSGARGIFTLGGLKSATTISIPVDELRQNKFERDHTCIHLGQADPRVFQDQARQRLLVSIVSPAMRWYTLYI